MCALIPLPHTLAKQMSLFRRGAIRLLDHHLQCPRWSQRFFSLSSRQWQQASRRKGKTTSVKLQDLPQGIIEADSPVVEHTVEQAPGYPTVISQARENMLKFDGCVLITRVGNFYELYFDQALHWGAQLGLKVASKRTSAGPVPMAGFPFFQLDRYLKIFVQEHGRHVAIAEETANNPAQKVKSGGLLFDRQVKRIITPGTLIDETFLSPTAHNYLLSVFIDQTALSSSDAPVGLAWIDLSSGDFQTQTADLASLSSAITRIGPGEVIFDQSLHGTSDATLAPLLAECGPKTTFYRMDEIDKANDRETLAQKSGTHASTMDHITVNEARSASVLLQYVEDQLPGLKLRFLPLQKYQAKEHMTIDKHTLRGLELLHTMRDGSYVGSLLHAVRRTVTRSGARLLAERLTSPSTSIPIINERLDLVGSLLNNEGLMEELSTILRNTTDSFRLVQSLACGKGDAESLLSLARTISFAQEIARVLEAAASKPGMLPLTTLLDRFQLQGPTKLAERILGAIDEDGLMARHRRQEDDAAEAASMAREAISANASEDLAALSKRLNARRFAKPALESDDESLSSDDIWVMRRSASATLSRLHSSLDELYQEKTALESSLRSKLNATSLTLKMTPSLGHIVHVKGKDVKNDLSVLENARTVSASKSTRSIYLSEWTHLGSRLDEARLRIRAEEQQIFRDLREAVCEEIVALRKNAGVLDDLDVACSSAVLARERDLVRPVLDETTGMTVVGGRHMTVEASLDASGRTFTPNDCFLGLPSSGVHGSLPERIQLITGPNMAGKSTYLRQTALLSILAQTGMYVPASHATLGVVDAVFSRIGAADNLFNDQSTFMVEMVETAAILRGATEKSLVVMDEVGRGTTPEDGVAVGYAVLDSLRRKRVGRVLFATHFHRLAEPDMCAGWAEVGCWSTRVVDERLPDGKTSFRFVHKMARGVNRESHALKVAMLAGMPEETIGVAAQVLKDIKQAG